MKSVFISIKILLGIVVLVLIFFCSVFYLGSEEAMKAAINDMFWKFAFYRFLFCMIAGLLVYFVSQLISFAFKGFFVNKRILKRLIWIELLVVIFLSLCFTLLSNLELI